MTDEPAPDQAPPPNAAEPATPPREEPAASQPPPEGHEEPAPAAQEPASGPEAPADEGEVAAPAAGEEKEEAQPPAPEAPPPPPVYYDGLESGLAWFGQEPFVPPIPFGYPTPQGVEEAGAAALPAERAVVNRKAVRERFEAKRKEAEAVRKWYQRIPIPIYFSMPAMIFIVIWICFVARPWERIPGPREKLDGKLVAEFDTFENQEARLKELGVTLTFPPSCWWVLRDGSLAMGSKQNSARVEIETTEMKNADVSCEVALLEGESAALLLEGMTSLSLDAARDGGYVRKCAHNGQRTQRELPVKYAYWYQLRIRIEPGKTRYFVNHYELSPESSRPPSVSKVTLSVLNCRAIFRKLTIEPLP